MRGVFLTGPFLQGMYQRQLGIKEVCLYTPTSHTEQAVTPYPILIDDSWNRFEQYWFLALLEYESASERWKRWISEVGF